MDGILLGPGPLAKAVTKPYETDYAWKKGEYCTHEGKIYKFIADDLLVGEEWTAAHWSEIKLTDEIFNIIEEISHYDPQTAVGLFTDVPFTINTNQWVEIEGIYSYSLSNNLIKENSGIVAYYDDSFKIALVGDIKVQKFTGYVTFYTNGEPQAALSGTLRILESVSGLLPVSRGGTGAVTGKGARNNLNISIRPIPVNFGTVSSLPQTVYDVDITADMIPSKWIYGTPSVCPAGLKCTTAAGSVTISLGTGQTFSGETTVYLELVNPRTYADDASGQSMEGYAGDFVQTGAQTLTASQKAQVRTNIDAAYGSDIGDIEDLTTTDKTNLVAAVNELDTDVDGLIGNINIKNISSSTTIASLCSSCPSEEHRYYGSTLSSTFSDFPSGYSLYYPVIHIYKRTSGCVITINGVNGQNTPIQINGWFENNSFNWEELALNGKLADVTLNPTSAVMVKQFTATGDTYNVTATGVYRLIFTNPGGQFKLNNVIVLDINSDDQVLVPISSGAVASFTRAGTGGKISMYQFT